MHRNMWEFEHTAAKLADAAEAKKRHHAGRLEWWETKKAQVMAQIREKGISVHETVAAESSQYTRPIKGVGARIMVDASLQRDLDECSEKVSSHRSMVDVYAGWTQVLRGNPEARLKLHHDDYLFFFGATSADDSRKHDGEELDDDV
jgi:hypothetical protein